MSVLQTLYAQSREHRPLIALAPMAGVTDLPFRTLCEGLGADYSVTEMAATAPQLLDSSKNQSRLHFTPNAHVRILQIIGNDAQQMASAAAHYADQSIEQHADIIDINLGCPAKKVHSKGAGSALLSDLAQVKSILTAVTEASPVPVTLKTRLGPDHDNYTLDEVTNMAESVGIDMITVHGRTRACRFNGYAQYDEIARIKQKYNLAVIANGDIDSRDKAQQVLNHTGCDGIMIGRAAIGNPWLFQQIRQVVDPDFANQCQPSLNEQVLRHIQQTHQFYGERKGVRFARKHIQKYLQHQGKSAYFSDISTIDNADEQITQLEYLLQQPT